jgi:hypothetical protein
MTKERKFARRDVLRALGAGAGVAVSAAGPLVREADGQEGEQQGKKRYQENSPDVQAYYRVNRYPTK